MSPKTNNTIVRHALEADCPQLLSLMKKLAVFEGYIDDFQVDESALIQYGFQKESSYTALVAESSQQLVAYLVYYLIPFTYDLKPTLFIKELWVDDEYRGKNIGSQLMEATIADAKRHQCGRIKWDVLANNHAAQRFYQQFGAYHDKRWQGYVLELAKA